MEIETQMTNHPVSKDKSSSRCKLLAFNLPSLIATMKQSYVWANVKLNSLILLKRPDKQIILTSMHEGSEIKSSPSNDKTTFEIIEGTLKFHIRKDFVTLNKGHLMTLSEHIKYSLTAQEETLFLLTITKGI
jgi:hypothetical protein